MYIEELHISSFGNLRDYSLELCPDINILEGDNETGKSTVADFIRFMFYGFDDKTDREKHIGFMSEVAAGSIIVKDGEKRWRIERQCGSKDSVKVFDLDDGSKCFEGRVPGEVFFGIPSSLFKSTVFVGQTGGGKIDGKSTSEAVENLLFSADENVDLKKALKKLSNARTELYHKNKKGGKIYENEEQISRLSTELVSASERNAEIISLKSSNVALTEKLETEKKLYEKFSGLINDYGLFEMRKRNERIKRFEEEYRQAENEHTAYVDEYTYNGFFPDRKYYSEIRESLNDISACENRIIDIQTRLDGLNAEIESERRKAERIAKEEEAEKTKVTAKRNKMVCVSVICCVLLLLTASASVILYLNVGKAAAAVSALLCALTLTGMIIGLGYTSRYNHTLKNYDKIISTKEDVYKEKLDMIRNELENARAERAKKKSVLDSMYEKWNALENPRLISEMKDIIEKERELAAEAEKRRINYVSRKTEAETSSERDPYDDGREISLPENFDCKDTMNRVKFLEKSIEMKKEKLQADKLRLTELTARTTEPTEILNRIDKLREENEMLLDKFNAYDFAFMMLERAGERMRSSVSPKLSEYSGELMSGITDGKYSEIGVDSGFTVTFRPETENGERQTREDVFMSTGTADAAYISLRLALVRLLCKGNDPPMVFDESFVHLDNTRLTNMLKMLYAGKSQILLLTSTDREATLIAKIEGADFRRVFV